MTSLYILFSCLTDPLFYKGIVRVCVYKLKQRLGYPRSRCLLHPLMPDVPASDPSFSTNVPVDLVYSWVDGNDPDYLALRNSWLEKHPSLQKANQIHARYIDNKELKLSLRTVERYLPWVNRIFIITNGQVPDWLDIQHPKIRMVNIDDVFPSPDCLPSFNSHAIEFQLHRIPELSEHFLYCCDDMMFGAPCTKEDFFRFDADGMGKLRLTCANNIIPPVWYLLSGQSLRYPFRAAWGNLKYTLEHRYPGYKIHYYLIHQAVPLRKSLMQAAATQYPELYERVSHSRFRAASDIPPIGFTAYMAIMENQALWCNQSNYCCNNLEDLKQHLMGTRAKLLCLNDLSDGSDVCEQLKNESFCNEPSSFEKKT
jgi:hypothetical protein